MLEQVRLLLKRESGQTDLIASLTAKAVEMAEGNQALTREIHAHTVAGASSDGWPPEGAAHRPTDGGAGSSRTRDGAAASDGSSSVQPEGAG